jgi:hypothetical protein
MKWIFLEEFELAQAEESNASEIPCQAVSLKTSPTCYVSDLALCFSAAFHHDQTNIIPPNMQQPNKRENEGINIVLFSS